MNDSPDDLLHQRLARDTDAVAPLASHNVAEHLAAFSDGELDAAGNVAVLDYLRAHPEALAFMREQQLLRLAARRAAGPAALATVPPALNARLRAIADERGNVSFDSVRRLANGWGRAAAALLIGLIAGAAAITLARRTPGTQKPSPPVAIAPQPSSGQPSSARPILSVVQRQELMHVHFDCSRVADRLHAGGYPKPLGDLATLVGKDVGVAQGTSGTPTAAPDLSSIGYRFVGAGPCAGPLERTVHLLYRKDGPEPRPAISVFVQRFDGQLAIDAGQVYVLGGPDDAFPMYCWRSDAVAYFLIAEDAGTAEAARQAIPVARQAKRGV